MEELKTRGRIYAYRYRPEGRIYGKPIDEYKGKCIEGKAFQVMIDNNLDFEIALYPYELVTYGETGQPCQNWLQYRLIKKYLEELTENQTLVVESGHPLGLFPSKPTAPRVIITNALMVGMFDNLKDWEIAEELGVANFGQMTAGGWMYIGPQGIVHGTFNTILNAGRKELGVPETVIALTFVALGTSLPELVTAITSLVKGHGSLSIGNIIGANLFNLVLVSGVSVTLAPFEVPVGKTIFGINSSLILDMPLMLVVMALLTIPALTTKKLHRWQGILLLCIYAAFCAIQFGL